jgi:hypothetical protein
LNAVEFQPNPLALFGFYEAVNSAPNREVPFGQFGEATLNVGFGVGVIYRKFPFHARRVWRGESQRVNG